MSFQEAITSVLQNYTNFSGRARRSEYWYFWLFTTIVGFVVTTLLGLCREDSILYGLLRVVDSLFGLAVLIPSLAVFWRRMHDIGKSGGNFFWGLLPIVGWIMLLVWLCREGDAGDNQYGPDPKEKYPEW